MLEHPRLLVRDWMAADAQGGPPRRPILDAGTLAPVGFACWEDQKEQPWWRRFVPITLEVRETDDESLLMLIRRRWGLGVSWEVRDADGRPVAVLRRGWVEDRNDAMMAVLQRAGRELRFRGLQGEDLGTVEPADEGMRVIFVEGTSPFLRMAVLTAALRW